MTREAGSDLAIGAILFDLDGTLLDTLTDLAQSMNQVLADWGCPSHPVDRYRWFVGDGVWMLAARALPSDMATEANIRACVHSFRQVYAQRWRETTRPYPGVEDVLQTLRELGVQAGVVTNKPHDAALSCLQAFFPQVHFAAVVGQSEQIPPKPDPKGLHTALDRCRISPARAMYVGDSGVDMQTAHRAGTRAVGVLWGFRTEQELVEHGAQHLVARAEELLQVVHSRD